MEGDYEIPVIDLKFGETCDGDLVRVFDDATKEKIGTDIRESLEKFGAVLVKDGRVSEARNSEFVEMLQKYFSQSREVKLRDVRKELNYQRGVTPDFIERARDHSAFIESLELTERPHELSSCDPKWRFFWSLKDSIDGDEYNVVPDGFRDVWKDSMDDWGHSLLRCIVDLCRFLAIGYGLPENSFRDLLDGGDHLLAPTGSYLGNTMNEPAIGGVCAAFHYDLNFLTIHGKSSHSGLYIWTREGKRLSVKVPAGCLLLQAGVQMEILTGGKIQRGFHEVVVTEKAKMESIAAQNLHEKWRVSSTVFSHVRSDAILQPLDPTWKAADLDDLPVTAREQVLNELRAIQLAESQM